MHLDIDLGLLSDDLPKCEGIRLHCWLPTWWSFLSGWKEKVTRQLEMYLVMSSLFVCVFYPNKNIFNRFKSYASQSHQGSSSESNFQCGVAAVVRFLWDLSKYQNNLFRCCIIYWKNSAERTLNKKIFMNSLVREPISKPKPVALPRGHAPFRFLFNEGRNYGIGVRARVRISPTRKYVDWIMTLPLWKINDMISKAIFLGQAGSHGKNFQEACQPI